MVSNLGSLSSLFASSFYGIQNAYQGALQKGANGISKDDLLNSSFNFYNANSSSFSSYLYSNFKNMDSNEDGSLTSSELSSVMNRMAEQGLTYQQLMYAGSSAGINSDDLNMLMSNFQKIDRNGDGRISSSEISYFSANKKVNDKIQELNNKRSSDFSIMYADDDNDNSSTKTSSISSSRIF